VSETQGDASSERIAAEDLGLPADARTPLKFIPGKKWSPLVISFPHVGLLWPHDLPPKPQVSFARNADFAVHTLYESAAELGAATVEAVYSRLVIDLNRATDDISTAIVPDHPAPRPQPGPRVGRTPGTRDSAFSSRGVIWDRALGDVPILEAPLTYEDFVQRVERYYEPYHRAVEILLDRRRARFGYAILLDAHSMPSSVGPDLVLGTREGRSCNPELAQMALRALSGIVPQAAEAHADAAELSVSRDDPYRGGELVRRFGRPAEGTHALQLEINRGLYMDERTNELWPAPRESPGAPPQAAPAPDAAARPTRARTADKARQARRLAALGGGVRCLIGVLAAEHAGLGLSPGPPGVPQPPGL
jgi:N-formylglutamate amidohydrolase